MQKEQESAASGLERWVWTTSEQMDESTKAFAQLTDDWLKKSKWIKEAILRGDYIEYANLKAELAKLIAQM